MPDAESRTQRALDAIKAYVACYPNAADAEDGIAQWWLPALGVYVPQGDVSAALERLVQMNVLERAKLADGSVIYRAASAAPAADSSPRT